MKRVTYLTFATTLALAGAACATDSSDEPGEDTSEMRLEVGRCDGRARDSFQLGKLAVDGSDLLIDVGTGGGCRPHTFSICWSGATTKSLPPQATFTVFHDGHDDMCDAYLQRTIRVDLTALRAEVTPPVVVIVEGATGQLDGTTNQILIE